MLETVDLTHTLDRQSYVREVTRRQIQLRELGYQVYLQKRPVIIVFEGWDAAGKGGAIKRITEKLDPRGYVVYPISSPHGEDRTRHYLYRFWRRLPARLAGPTRCQRRYIGGVWTNLRKTKLIGKSN